MAMSGDGNIPQTGMMALCANGGVAQQITGTVLEWDFSNITTGTGIQLDLDSMTTGTGLEIRVDSDILTTGKILDIKAGSTMGTSVFTITDTGKDGFVTITGTGDSAGTNDAALLVKNTSAGTTGAVLRLQHDSASPATNDLVGIIEVYADNTPGTATEYGSIQFKNIGVTTNVEATEIQFHALRSGALNEMMVIGDSNAIVQINSPAAYSTVRNLDLVSTSASAAGPGLRFHHNSASPATNDIIASVQIYGENTPSTATEMAHIDFKMTGVTSGSEASEISFYQRVADTDTETLRLDASGLLVKSAGYIAGSGTSANGIILKNLKNSAETNLTGTTQTVTIDLNGVPYYFTVYPSKDA